jgi:hypothetical protein
MQKNGNGRILKHIPVLRVGSSCFFDGIGGSRRRHPKLRLPSLVQLQGRWLCLGLEMRGQNQPGLGDIPVDLFDQFGDAGELYLVSQSLHKVDHDFLAVNILIEVEDVGLHREYVVVEGGAVADVGHARR